MPQKLCWIRRIINGWSS